LHSTEKLQLSDLGSSSPLLNRSLSPLRVKIELNKAKLFRFSVIFKLLNPTSKGKIFFRRSMNAATNQRLLSLLSPILENLSTIPQGINYREFCFKMEILLKYLNDQEKYFLFSPHLYTKTLQLPNRHRQSPPRCKSALNTKHNPNY